MDSKDDFSVRRINSVRWILTFQVLLIVVSPLLQLVTGSQTVTNVLFWISLVGLSFVSFLIITTGRLALVLGISIAGVLAILQISASITSNQAISLIYFAGLAGVIGLVFCRFIRLLMKTREVTLDTLLIGISSYLMLAVFWAAMYSICTLLDPSAFSFSSALQSTLEGRIVLEGKNAGLAIYFSTVTQTTLGYGDITPVSSLARMLVSAQALMGQIYVAILIGRLVGLSIVSKNKEN
ncbi:MAG: potassium channel family protein [Verrucomicrobiota bacterium]